MFVFYSAECYINRTVVQCATISLAFGDGQNHLGNCSSLSFVDSNSKAGFDRKEVTYMDFAAFVVPIRLPWNNNRFRHLCKFPLARKGDNYLIRK